MTILKNRKNQNPDIFILKQKIKEAEGVMTLKFLAVKAKIFSFEPGQFVLVSFLDNRAEKRVRAYSISSHPKEKFLAITVKKLGVFSSALHNLKIGEKIKVSPAQGDFYPKKSMKNLVFLAAGIGIVPFFCVLKDWSYRGLLNKCKIMLFYCNRTKKETAFFKEFNKIAKQEPNFKVIYFLTREKSKDKKIGEFCRPNIKILKKYLKNFKRKYYFLCGPMDFVNDLRQELKKNGVGENFIKTEALY